MDGGLQCIWDDKLGVRAGALVAGSRLGLQPSNGCPYSCNPVPASWLDLTPAPMPRASPGAPQALR